MGVGGGGLLIRRPHYRPKLPRNSRNYRELDSIQILLTTLRKHDCIFRRLQNAFLQAPKDTHCSQNKFEITQIRIQLPESKWQNAFLGACKMHFCRRLGQLTAQSFLRAVRTIAMSVPPKQCSRPSGNRTYIFWGLQNASLQAPRTTRRPKLPRNSRNYREPHFHPSFA